MVEPTGYTALDLIGFTDRGLYDPTANYVRNDLVHVGNSTWRCKIDDTTGITPTEGANWTIYLESATSLAGMDDTDIVSPKNGDGLVHDGNDWKNVPIMTKELEIKTGAHNLLRFPTLVELQALNTSGSWSGNIYTFGNVTYAIDFANETITVNCSGTGANNSRYLSLYNRLSKRYYVENGDYKVNGVDSGVDGKFQITVSATTYGATSQAWEVKGIDKEGASFTYNSSQVDGLGVSINVNENYAVNNVVVKPMIRYAIDKTTDHALFAMTNRQLTEVKTYRYQTADAEANVTYLECNVLKNGRIVYITGSWQGNNTNAEALLTLPSELRPSDTVRGTGGLYVPSHPTITTQFGVYNLTSGGKISQAMDTRKGMMGSFVFVYNL